MADDMLRYLANEVGLKPAGRCLLDYRFLLALVAGILVVWLDQSWLPPIALPRSLDGPLLLSLVLWQPLFEEILFRGLIQGQLIKHAWGRRSWLQISMANGVTSLLFVGLHLFMNPPLAALLVFIPSLVYGYFRDQCDSVVPSIVLHCAYNAFVAIGLAIAGNVVWSSAL